MTTSFDARPHDISSCNLELNVFGRRSQLIHISPLINTEARKEVRHTKLQAVCVSPLLLVVTHNCFCYDVTVRVCAYLLIRICKNTALNDETFAFASSSPQYSWWHVP